MQGTSMSQDAVTIDVSKGHRSYFAQNRHSSSWTFQQDSLAREIVIFFPKPWQFLFNISTGQSRAENRHIFAQNLHSSYWIFQQDTLVREIVIFCPKSAQFLGTGQHLWEYGTGKWKVAGAKIYSQDLKVHVSIEFHIKYLISIVSAWLYQLDFSLKYQSITIKLPKFEVSIVSALHKVSY